MAKAQHLTTDKLLRVAILATTQNPLLLDCDLITIVKSVQEAASLGLELGSILGHAYLVPFRNYKRGGPNNYVMECQLMPGYKGIIDLAVRSGKIGKVEAHWVGSKDVFKIELGINQKLEHVPNYGDRGDFKLCYSIAHYTNGMPPQIEVMTVDEIDVIMERSPSFKAGGPWKKHKLEMAKKTVAKRNLKYCPQSTELAKAIALDNAIEAGESQSPIMAEDAEFYDFPDEVPDEERTSASDKLADDMGAPPAEDESNRSSSPKAKEPPAKKEKPKPEAKEKTEAQKTKEWNEQYSQN